MIFDLDQDTFNRAEGERRGDPASARQEERTFDERFDEREQKRLRRLSYLGDLAMAVADELGRQMIGKLPAADPQMFARGNLEGAFNRTARTIRQFTALETKLEEERRARLTRTAEEETAHRNTILAETARREAARTSAVEGAAFGHRKKTIRAAVELAHEDALPKMDPMERENLLDDLFTDFDDYEDWDEDDAVIVYKLLGRMGCLSRPRGEEPEPNPDDRQQRPKIKAIAMAQGYLDEVVWETDGAANDPGPGHDPAVANTS